MALAFCLFIVSLYHFLASNLLFSNPRQNKVLTDGGIGYSDTGLFSGWGRGWWRGSLTILDLCRIPPTEREEGFGEDRGFLSDIVAGHRA